MKQWFLILLSAALTGSACQPTQATTVPATDTLAGDQQVSPRDVELTLLTRGVWLHTSHYTYPDGVRFPSNGLVVQEKEQLVLVDTAWGELLTHELLTLIESRIGLPVARAIVTHFHYDRLAGADVLEKRGVPVFAHPRTRELSSDFGAPVPNQALPDLAPVGATAQFGSLELFYPGPAHSDDNIVVWAGQRQVLFGGCAVRALAADSVGNTASADLEQWPQALLRIQARYPEPQLVVPGHGAVGDANLLNHTLSLFDDTKTAQ